MSAPINNNSKHCVKFIKCHANGNDFLIVVSQTDLLRPQSTNSTLSASITQPHLLALELCNRRTGIGADGLILTSSLHGISSSGDIVKVKLWNSDGSKAEISGNGTCCVAAVVASNREDVNGNREGESSFIAETGAGRRKVTIQPGGREFVVEMAVPKFQTRSSRSEGMEVKGEDGSEFLVEMNVRNKHGERVKGTVLNVGNPQCAMFYDEETVPEDWREVSSEIATNTEMFPEGTNVSFSRVIGRHTLQTNFYERGAGETSSSGTGSIGAAVSAIVRGLVESPVTVRTTSGELKVSWNGIGDEVHLKGHAEIVGEGTFFASMIEEL